VPGQYHTPQRQEVVISRLYSTLATSLLIIHFSYQISQFWFCESKKSL